MILPALGKGRPGFRPAGAGKARSGSLWHPVGMAACVLALWAFPAAGASLPAASGQAFLTALEEAVQDDHAELRDAAWVLRTEGLDPAEVAAELARLAAGPDSQTALRAVRHLGSLGAAARAAVPALQGALLRNATDLRAAAAAALGRVGPAARAALPALKALESDPDPSVRRRAREAVRRLR